MQTWEVEANLVKLNEKFQLSYIPDLIDPKLAGEEKSVLEDTDIAFYHQERDRLINILEDASFTSHSVQDASVPNKESGFFILIKGANAVFLSIKPAFK